MSMEIKFRYRVTGANRIPIMSHYTLDDLPEHMNDHKEQKRLVEFCGQYTGLKDKNGKEIYEGDIIKDNDGIGLVRYIAPQFIVITKDSKIWNLGGGKVYPQPENRMEFTEVLGNQHENPELLTQ